MLENIPRKTYPKISNTSFCRKLLKQRSILDSRSAKAKLREIATEIKIFLK